MGVQVLSTKYLLRCAYFIALVVLGSDECSNVVGQDSVRAFPVAEAPFSAELAGIDAEWNISFRAGGKVRVLAAADLAYWGRIRDVESGPQIVLADGSLIRADLLGWDQDQVVLGDATGLGRGQWDESWLPKSALRGLMFHPPASQGERDKLLRVLSSYREAHDRLFLPGGETIDGAVIALPKAGKFTAEAAEGIAEAVQFRRANAADVLSVPLTKVIAIGFGGRAEAPAGLPARSAWVGFADGSLLRTSMLVVKEGIITITFAGGGALKSNVITEPQRVWDDIAYVEPISPRVTWASDLQPLGYKHIPFLSVQRDFGRDQNALFTRLRSGGAVFRKGLGMPSAARLAYDVAGYRRFEAKITLDDQAGLRGSVIYKVVLETSPNEWQVAYESPVIRGGDAPQAISVELKGAARLALLTDFAERGDECDYANWLNARLIK